MQFHLRGDHSGGNASIKEGFNTSDFLGVAGAEFFIAEGIGVSGRYQLGFGNIFNNEASQALSRTLGSNVLVKNNSFTLTVGYRF